jgi:hypothetical protein
MMAGGSAAAGNRSDSPFLFFFDMFLLFLFWFFSFDFCDSVLLYSFGLFCFELLNGDGWLKGMVKVCE